MYRYASKAGCRPRDVVEDGRGAPGSAPSESRRIAVLSWCIVLAAVELLCSERLSLVKEGRGHDCGWMFVETGRNKTRGWCNMKACGNRAKAARYYARHAKKKTNAKAGS